MTPAPTRANPTPASGLRWLRLESRFQKSAAVLLLLTALAKGVSAFGSGRILANHDAIFWWFSNRDLLLAVAAVETLVAGLLLSKWPVSVKRGGLLWLCANFLLYRAGLWLTGAPAACKCLGDMAERLGVSDAQASGVMLGILGYLTGGSLLFLWKNRSPRQTEALPAPPIGSPELGAS
jgi:hypothetical protein